MSSDLIADSIKSGVILAVCLLLVTAIFLAGRFVLKRRRAARAALQAGAAASALRQASETSGSRRGTQRNQSATCRPAALHGAAAVPVQIAAPAAPPEAPRGQGPLRQPGSFRQASVNVRSMCRKNEEAVEALGFPKCDVCWSYNKSLNEQPIKRIRDRFHCTVCGNTFDGSVRTVN
jgi:hypothetical protein